MGSKRGEMENYSLCEWCIPSAREDVKEQGTECTSLFNIDSYFSDLYGCHEISSAHMSHKPKLVHCTAPYVQAKAVFAERLRDKASKLMQTYCHNPVFSPFWLSPTHPSLVSSKSFSTLQLHICDRLGQITKDYLHQTQSLHGDHGHLFNPPYWEGLLLNILINDWLSESSGADAV